ncbi:MAG TPA: hypothetical protein VF838_08205 [Trebonia sp.]
MPTGIPATRGRWLWQRAGYHRPVATTIRFAFRSSTAELVEENGWRWHILHDPDGNEFCVLQPPPDYWAGTQES